MRPVAPAGVPPPRSVDSRDERVHGTPDGDRRRRAGCTGVPLTSIPSARRLADLEKQAADPSLWDDPAKGRRVTSELARLNAELDRVDDLQRKLDDALALDELLTGADDPDLERELASTVESLEGSLDSLRLEALLGGEYDGHDAIATVQAGAGGTESQDWAEMLLRMFSRWAERRSFDVDVDEVHHGEEAGIKSATFTVRGHNAYGLLSAERGVHRLVRIEPVRRAEAPPHLVRVARRHPGPRRRGSRGGRGRRGRPPHRRIPVERPGGPGREHHRLGGADRPTCRPGSSSRVRTSGRSFRTARPR